MSVLLLYVQQKHVAGDIVSFPDPAFFEWVLFEQFLVFSRPCDIKIVMATSLKAIDSRELYRAS